MAFDAIVVGGGPAGCAISARLGQSGRRVLLLEAGPGEPRPATVAGLDTVAASQETSRLWPAGSDPDVESGSTSGLVGGPTKSYRQGFGLGGGSLVNSLVLSPGDRGVYDRWRSVHGCDWDAEAMDPWLAAALTAIPGEPAPPGPFGAAFNAAASAAGHRHGGSTLDQDRGGIVAPVLAVAGDRRRTASDGYGIGTASLADSVTVATDSMVARVVTAGRSARGVELVTGERFGAPLVVLCGGAIQTPALLQRSGLTTRPVGEGLQDHPSFAFTAVLRSDGQGGSESGRARGERSVSTVLKWASEPDGELDLQAIVIDRVDDVDDKGAATTPLAVVVVGLMAVTSRGAVRATDTAISATTGALESPEDRRRLRRGVRTIYDLLSGPEMAEVIDEFHIDERATGAAELVAMDDHQLDRWLVANPGPYAHPAGSCPMGDPDRARTVVSGRAGELGRLLDHDGIYVADASIMPELVNGGLQLPVMAMAERIASELVAGG